MSTRTIRFKRTKAKNNATNSPVYNRWNHMRHRCYVESDSEYFRYGAKGVTVYDKWLEDFWEYEKYVMSLPNALSPNFTLDRINTKGNYEPGNLRWASKTTQSRNCRVSSNNKSGHTGVCWHKVAQKWRTYIMVDRKHIHIGMFVNKDEAIAARKKAELQYKF